MSTQTDKENAPAQIAHRHIKRRNLYSLWITAGIGIICFVLLSYFEINSKQVNDSLLELNTNFGISLSAFALSALAIVYALPSGEVLTRFRKTPGYFAVVICLQRAIIWCLANFVGGYFFRLLGNCNNLLLEQAITSFSLVLAINGVHWVYLCIENMFIVILES